MKIYGHETAVCFVSNLEYVPHFCVEMLLFAHYNPGAHAIYLFNEDIPDSEFITLRRALKKISPESELRDIKLDTQRLNHFTGYWEKLGKQVFHRLLITEELPESIEYALYLDADIVIRNPFAFDELPLNDFSVFAVKDAISDILAPKRGLPSYFNAGVMLLNVRRWKEKDAVNKLLRHKPVKTLFAEQELLNEVFVGDWFALNQAYNFGAHRLKKAPFSYRMRGGEEPKVIHYVGPIKPWIYWVRGSLLYWSWIFKSPYKTTALRMPLTLVNTLKHKLLGIRK